MIARTSFAATLLAASASWAQPVDITLVPVETPAPPPPVVAVAQPAPARPVDRHAILEALVGPAYVDLYGSTILGGAVAASVGGEGTWCGGSVDLDGFVGATMYGLRTSAWTLGGSFLVRPTRSVTLGLGMRMGELSVARVTAGDDMTAITLGAIVRGTWDVRRSPDGTLFLAARFAVDGVQDSAAVTLGVGLGVRAF